MDHNYPADEMYYQGFMPEMSYQFAHGGDALGAVEYPQPMMHIGPDGMPASMGHIPPDGMLPPLSHITADMLPPALSHTTTESMPPPPISHTPSASSRGRPTRAAPPRAATRKRAQPAPRKQMRPKTQWTTEQTLSMFRIMAEYTFVDKAGIQPLVIYLNQNELDHVVQCEARMDMTDAEISASLAEQEVENNGSRGPHLMLEVLRHMQRASGNHPISVVNEKMKNARSRIVNWFGNMHKKGELPTKRPARYVTAILNSIVTSPFCPVKDSTAAMSMGLYATAENKHDVILWLNAMFWIYPRKMYEFVYQCALKIVRTRIEATPVGNRTQEEHHMVESENPDTYVLIDQLRRLIGILNNEESPKNGGSVGGGGGGGGRRPQRGASASDAYGMYEDIEDEAAGSRKRRRKALPNENTKWNGFSDVMVPTNGDDRVALSMFDAFNTADKLKIAGMRVKMLAAVGGVIRNGHASTSLDIKYHLYRLWTCVARFKEVSRMLVPTSQIPFNEAASWSRFAEFVVVRDHYSPFDIVNIEPRIRVSKTRMAYKESDNAEDLIRQWVASTEGEHRPEIPVWLTICRRIDGEYVLALVVSSLDTQLPAAADGSDPQAALPPSTLEYRKFSDSELTTVIDSAIANGGEVAIGEVPMRNHGGLDHWPWDSEQEKTVLMTHGYWTQIRADVAGSTVQLVISSAYADSPNVIDPWMEPRVMCSTAFSYQKRYAEDSAIGEAPTFNDLIVEEQKPIGGMPVTRTVLARSGSSGDPLSWQQAQQVPLMRLDEHNLATLNPQLSGLAPPDLASTIHEASAAASAAAMESYPAYPTGNYDPSAYQVDSHKAAPPMIDGSGGLLLDPTQGFPVDMLSTYADNGWTAGNFDPTSPYPHMFSGSGAPSEYGPP
ncbi:hypothetical protein H4R18_001228 [Coemansia javaensis]|uniref:Uncharacterized protein n=1 Tax=Coemansia javaensis TaxID=2761396 RepID=A0A9W8LLW1_9FUNG|nr:hypothetical protein H4R18_001228 [Coemansia javaensis]